MPGTAWGLDIGRWSTKVIRATHEKNSETIELDLYDSINYGDLQCGSDAPDIEKYREAIRVFGEQYEIEKNDSLCVSIPGGEVFSRFITLPPVPERIGEIVRYEARQQIPFDMDRVVWDYEPVVKDPAPGEEMEVGIFAIKEERIDEFMDMLRPWEDNLDLIQCAPLSVHNSLAFEGHTDEPLVVLDIGSQSSDLLTVNYPRFWMRPLLVGGDNMTSALADTFGVSREQAETVKKRVKGSGREPQVLRAISDVVGNLVSEVQRSLGYYKSVDREAKLERMIVLGNTVKLPALTRLINLQLQYEVEEIQDVHNFRLGPDIDREAFAEDVTGLWGALGLAVQAFGFGRISVNLIPEEIVEKKEAQRKKPWLVAAAGLVVVMLVVFGFAEMLYGQKLAQKPQDAVQLSKTLEQYQSQVDEQKQQVQEMKTRLQSITTTEVPRGLFVQLLPSFAQYLPQNVYLTEMHFEWVSPTELEQIRQGNVGGPFEGSTDTTGPSMGGMPGMGGGPMGGRGGQGGPGGSGGGPGGGPMGGGAGGPGGSGGGPGGGGAGPATVGEKSIDSRLVVWFEAESGRRQQGLQYVKQSVFERLRQMQMPQADRSAFEEVKMVGDPTELYRSSIDGRIVSQQGEGGRRGRGGGSGGQRRGRTMSAYMREMGRMGPGMESGGGGGARSTVEEEQIYFLRFRGYALVDLQQKDQVDEEEASGSGSGAAGGMGAGAGGTGPGGGTGAPAGGGTTGGGGGSDQGTDGGTSPGDVSPVGKGLE